MGCLLRVCHVFFRHFPTSIFLTFIKLVNHQRIPVHARSFIISYDSQIKCSKILSPKFGGNFLDRIVPWSLSNYIRRAKFQNEPSRCSSWPKRPKNLFSVQKLTFATSYQYSPLLSDHQFHLFSNWIYFYVKQMGSLLRDLSLIVHWIPRKLQ